MSTLTKIKGKVVNPDLPVLTKYGLLSQIVGKYANKLDAVDIVLTQTEVDALGVFITDLKDGNVLEHITALYPFIGNPNIPLIGGKDLEFSDVTPSNTKLAFSGSKLLGYVGLNTMANVKLVDLIPDIATNGFQAGGSMLYAAPSSSDVVKYIISFGSNRDILQYRINLSNSLALVSWDSEGVDKTNFPFIPAIEASQTQKCYCYTHGLATAETPPIVYNRTLLENGTVLSNVTGTDSVKRLEVANSDQIYIYASNNVNIVFTTLVFFDGVLTKEASRAFCQALNKFVNAVGKSVTV